MKKSQIMDSEDVTTGVVMAAVKGRRGRGRGARGGTAVPAKAVGIVPVKTAGRGRPKGSGRKQKLLETEVETVVAVPLPLPNEEIPGIVASTSDSSELLIGSDDSKQIPKSPIQSPTTIDNSKLLSGSIESIDKKEDITLTPTTTIDMDADISQLEAPKFTTISRGPPEPMLRLKWDHTVSLIGEKVLNPMIHCCDQCEKPILIYGRMIPCKHVFCLKCARAEPQKQCLRCKDKVMRVEQSGLGTVFMCTHGGSRYGNTGCRRTYLSQRDLQAHINHRHVTVVATANTDSKSVNAKVMTANVARDVRKTDQSQPIQTPSQPHLTSGNNGNPGAGSGLRQRQPSQSFSSNQSNIPITPSGTGSLPARNNLITIPIQESAQSADVEMSSSHHLSGLVTGNVNVHQQQTSIQHNQSQPMDMSTSNYYNSNQSIQSTGNYGQYSTNSNITSIIQSHHQFMGAGGNSGPNIGGGQTGNPISLLQQTGLVHQMRSQIMMPQSGQSVTNSGFFSSGYGQQQPQNLTSNNQQSYQQELMFQQQQQQQQQQAAQMSSGMQRNYHSNEQQQQQAWNQQQYYR